MGVNYARMEIQNQPLGGWSVDLWRQTCPCNYWFMFGSQGRDVLVNRKKRRRGDTGGAGPGGRPRFAGPALCIE
ncbi:hypothetical protein L916_18274 [Phytophthora nicotianae]|uniref:Uncharacterized protein n=1 Tax=Phytophthora nicotianae TaxID=4792 RepID=W2I298_PHYNI|nr:hypothetical protein L916_18274 [Phytophthora nicotianae]